MATFVDYALPADPRTGKRSPIVLARPNHSKERNASMTLPEMNRSLLALQDYVYDQLAIVAQLPFGGPITYLKNVEFFSDGDLTLPHLLTVIPLPAGAAFTRASSPVRFLTAHPSKAARFHFVAVDTRTITLRSDADCIVDVLLMVAP